MNTQINYRSELWKLLPENAVVAEVGVAEGRLSEVMLLWGCIGKLYLIDVWQHLEQSGDGGYPQSWHDNNLKEVKERIAGNEDKVIILQGLSVEMANQIPDESLGMVYIDADHTKQGCLADLNAFYPKVKKGGFVCGHDILNDSYGVKEAVEEFFRAKRLAVNIIPDEEPAMASYWIQKI